MGEAEDVAARIARGEGPDTEFKVSLADSRRIVETVAGMATIGGGTILVGVRDDGRVIGTQLGKGELERLVQQVLSGTDPKVFIEVDQPVVEGLRLVRIRVPAADGPHLAFGRAFHRTGRSTVAMSRDEYERRLLDRLRESGGFERRWESGWTLDDIDPEAVRAFSRAARPRLPSIREDDPPATILARLNVAGPQGPSVAAILLFGKDPQRLLPQATLRARAERGVATDARAVEGTLFRQIEEATAFVLRNLHVLVRREDLQREEVPELPSAAIREVIANAVAHRDYRSTAPIQVLLSDTALEVWNPGHLPPPLTPAALRLPHPSVPTNPLIARALFLAGYIEEWGTGTLRVIQSLRDAGSPEPLFEAPEGGFRVVLPLPGSEGVGVAPRLAKALGKLARGQAFTSAEFAGASGVARRTAVQDLSMLERSGLVRRLGQGKATRWERL